MKMIEATDPLEPNTPKRAFEAALWGIPERAARLAALEAACREAKTDAEYRVSGMKISALIREVEDELAPDWPQVWYSGKDQPPDSGHSVEDPSGDPRGRGVPARDEPE